MNACRTATLGLRLLCDTRQFGNLCNGCQCERAAGELIAQGRGAVEPGNSTSSLSSWMLQGVCRAGVGSSLALRKHAAVVKPTLVNRRSMQSVKRLCTAVSTATPAQVQRLTGWLRAYAQ